MNLTDVQQRPQTAERRSILFAILLTLLTLGVLWLDARPHGFLNCDMECGETLISVRAAENFAKYGVRFGLLDILGPEETPSVYTHNVNIGTLTFVLLQSLGVTSFANKTLLPLAAHGLGLFYVFLCVRLVTRSPLAALISLLVFATSYWGLGSFALNALRAWHMLAFFAVIFHTSNLFHDNTLNRLHVIGLVFGAVVAFGCGYDFWILCGAVALSLIAFDPQFTLHRKLVSAATLAVIFGLPFVARQFQVIYALGAAYWWQDLLFTLAIKIPYASTIIALPPIVEIDAWYRSQNVLRPPASATNSLLQIYDTFRHMLTSVTIPRWGWLSMATLIAVAVFPFFPRLRCTIPGAISRRLILPMLAGMLLGLLFLAPFSLHVYFKHEFPLFVFPLLLAKSAFIALLVQAIVASPRYRTAAAIAVVLVILDAAMTHRNNTLNGPSNNFEWVNFVISRPNAEFILATYDPSLSHHLPALANAKMVFIRPERAPDVLNSPPSGSARFLVYQPIEQMVDFDAKVPKCNWRDWITTLLKDPPPVSYKVSCIYGYPLSPDAKPQPSLDEIARAGPVVARGAAGIGYVVIALP